MRNKIALFGIMALFVVLAVPAASAHLDYVNIGDPASEAGHNLYGWGPVEPATHGGNWGGRDDGTIRVTWYSDNGTGANCSVPCETPDPNGREANFIMSNPDKNAWELQLRVLDGIANDSFDVYIDGSKVYSYIWSGDSTEFWITHNTSVSAFEDKDPLNITINATGPQWSGWQTHGQLGVSWARLFCVPGIDVEKRVWDPETEEWAKYRVAKVGDTMRFNCTIHAKCCNLTNIVVTDNLSDSLEYAGNAIPGEPDEEITNPDGTTTLKWYFSELKKCNTTYIEFDAHKIKVCNNNNTINVSAWCNETEPIQVSNQSTADIICGDVEKPDLVITDKWMCWPDNCTICYNITNIDNGTAPASHNTTLYVDGNETAHDIVPVLLAPNESYISCFENNWSYTPPSDNITICADNNETIDESNETNNCLMNLWMCGDVRKDGSITGRDVSKLNNYVYGIGVFEIWQKWAGDVHTNGSITGRDVSKLNNYVYGTGTINCMCTQTCP